MGTTSYAVALGSNRRHGRYGAPERVIAAAVVALGESMTVVARSATYGSRPLGPSARRFANAAVVVATDLSPPALLALLKSIEREFGRRRGRRWGARVLDLDILLWSEGRFRSARQASSLSIPHPQLARRAFVLRPLGDVAPDWRHPDLGVTFCELWVRLHRASPVDRPRWHP